MERLPDEVLLEILEFGRNPNLALVSRRLTSLLGPPEIKEMIVMECCRQPRLHLSVQAQKALAGLFASKWFTMGLLYRHTADWIWKQAEDAIVDFIGGTDEEQQEVRSFTEGALCKGSSISSGFMQGWTICAKDKQVEVQVEYGHFRPDIQALAWMDQRMSCLIISSAIGYIAPCRRRRLEL